MSAAVYKTHADLTAKSPKSDGSMEMARLVLADKNATCVQPAGWDACPKSYFSREIQAAV